jgi:hypothetical protein
VSLHLEDRTCKLLIRRISATSAIGLHHSTISKQSTRREREASDSGGPLLVWMQLFGHIDDASQCHKPTVQLAPFAGLRLG